MGQRTGDFDLDVILENFLEFSQIDGGINQCHVLLIVAGVEIRTCSKRAETPLRLNRDR